VPESEGARGVLLGSRRFHLALLLITGCYALPGIVGWRGLVVPAAHWVAHLLVVGGGVGLALGLRHRLPRLADALVAAAWALGCNATTAPLTYALMRARTPLHDATLGAFDAAIGLPVPRVQAWLSVLPQAVWWSVYDLLTPLLVCAVVGLPLAGHTQRARALVLAYVASFALAMPLIAWLPAEGPWALHGYPPSPEQASYVVELTALRAPGPFSFDTTRITGVVTFPSFHALLAALGGWALAPLRGLGALAVGVSVGIVVATVTTGWHYVADVVGGLAVAAVAVRLAEGFELRWR
jgi:hypothetical protein